jgi:hypothetical protein
MISVPFKPFSANLLLTLKPFVTTVVVQEAAERSLKPLIKVGALVLEPANQRPNGLHISFPGGKKRLPSSSSIPSAGCANRMRDHPPGDDARTLPESAIVFFALLGKGHGLQ